MHIGTYIRLPTAQAQVRGRSKQAVSHSLPEGGHCHSRRHARRGAARPAGRAGVSGRRQVAGYGRVFGYSKIRLYPGPVWIRWIRIRHVGSQQQAQVSASDKQQALTNNKCGYISLSDRKSSPRNGLEETDACMQAYITYLPHIPP